MINLYFVQRRLRSTLDSVVFLFHLYFDSVTTLFPAQKKSHKADPCLQKLISLDLKTVLSIEKLPKRRKREERHMVRVWYRSLNFTKTTVKPLLTAIVQCVKLFHRKWGIQKANVRKKWHISAELSMNVW